MKVVIFSDTHFGDELGALVSYQNGEPVLGPRYTDFRDAVGQDNDYFILLGDIFDFSIKSYAEAYQAGKVFFDQVKKDRLVKQFVYVAGNHDSDMWQIVEHQVNIINQIGKGKPPRSFKWSLPGVFDLRSGAADQELLLPGVTRNSSGPRYGGLFLDAITGDDDSERTPFCFAYPNVYIATDDETVLVTHGHYLETYWSLLGDLAQLVAGEDMRSLPEGKKLSDPINLKDLVALNFPLNQLACTGVGQAGPLTEIVRMVMQEVKAKELDRVEEYIYTALDDGIFEYKAYDPREWATDAIARGLTAFIINKLKNSESARYNTRFLQDEDVRERFLAFYRASLVELDHLKNEHGIDLPAPQKVIFGHTHEPTPWAAPEAPMIDVRQDGREYQVQLYNTGGWLYRRRGDALHFTGADIFFFETGKSVQSISLR